MVWLNVDKPTKRCTIHTDLDCRYVVDMIETSLKGIGELKKDGGWLSLPGVVSAENFCRKEYQGYPVTICC